MPHFSSFAGFRWGCEAGQTVGTWKCKAFCRSVRLKSRSIRARWNNFETLFIEKDIMYRCWIDGNRIKRQTVILWSERRNVLKMCHDSKISCHLGIKKTLARVRQSFYWPELQRCPPECSGLLYFYEEKETKESKKRANTDWRIRVSNGAHCSWYNGTPSSNKEREQVCFSNSRLFHQMGLDFSHGKYGGKYCRRKIVSKWSNIGLI